MDVISNKAEPKLLLPFLEPFYAYARDLSWPLVRIIVGGTLLTHGIRKLMYGTFAGFAANSMARRGFDPHIAYLIYFNETIGSIFVMLGLFTRFVAASIAIELAVIMYFVWPNGFVWNNPRGGWQYILLMGVLFFAIALRGGGPYSLDRKLGIEL